jgi:hypothetical protein
MHSRADANAYAYNRLDALVLCAQSHAAVGILRSAEGQAIRLALLVICRRKFVRIVIPSCAGQAIRVVEAYGAIDGMIGAAAEREQRQDGNPDFPGLNNRHG